MALIKRFTPGGNFYPDGQSTFAVLREIFQEIATTRDAVDVKLKADTKAEIVTDVPELGGGFGVAGPDGVGRMILDADGNLHPDLGAATDQTVDAKLAGYAPVDDVPDSDAGVGFAGPDGTLVWLLGADGNLHPDVVEKLEAAIHPATEPEVEALTFAAPPATAVGSLSTGILNQANKYLLNTWLPSAFPGSGAISGFGGTAEGNIRHPAAAAFGIAAAVATGTHAPVTTGKDVAQATAAARRLVAGLAAGHAANGGSWGGADGEPPINTWDQTGWQSALWAYYAGAAGWLLWGSLNDTERKHVLAMIRWEAGRMLRWRLPFWKTATGSTNYAGDSKSEEISWDSAIVALAVVMMPTDHLAPVWNAKLMEMGYVSHAAPSDITADETTNGFTGADVLTGYNINDDGTIINHDRVHPDYMVSAGTSHWGFLFAYGATKQDAPKALTHNAAKIYGALSTLEFTTPEYAEPGGTIYVPGSADLYYPEGNDWGTHRIMDKALMDVLAARHGWDGGLPTSAETWAELHLQRQADYQARGTDGRTYQAPEEDTFNGREQWVSANAAFAVLNLCAPTPHVSNATPDTITSRNRSL